jgi:hypothetical protein
MTWGEWARRGRQEEELGFSLVDRKREAKKGEVVVEGGERGEWVGGGLLYQAL